jgi:hypothetical protein
MRNILQIDTITPELAADLEQLQLQDEHRLMVKALRDINHHLQHGSPRQAQKVLAHVSLSIPQIGEPV